MNKYTIKYIMVQMDRTLSEPKEVTVYATSKEQAYDWALFKNILEHEPYPPFKVWVDSVRYRNGNVRYYKRGNR